MQGLFNNETENGGVAFAVLENRAGENSLELVPYFLPLRICAGTEDNTGNLRRRPFR
jgi:hypothetical protein